MKICNKEDYLIKDRLLWCINTIKWLKYHTDNHPSYVRGMDEALESYQTMLYSSSFVFDERALRSLQFDESDLNRLMIRYRKEA